MNNANNGVINGNEQEQLHNQARKVIPIKLPSYNRMKQRNDKQHTVVINGFNTRRQSDKNKTSPSSSSVNNSNSYICYLFCCCIEQRDPLFFILLAGLFLHDGSFLAFRIFILSKLGWEATFNQSPTLAFFLVKNVFIIVTQMYKVYSVTSERRQRQFYENYRDFVLATQQDNYLSAIAAAATAGGSTQVNSNKINMNSNVLMQQQNFNAALAAATGGQVPLVPLQSFNQHANYAPPFMGNANQQMFLNQHVYQPPTSNPYRFAQIYAENIGGANTAVENPKLRRRTSLSPPKHSNKGK
jgi:hypothetical protein